MEAFSPAAFRSIITLISNAIYENYMFLAIYIDLIYFFLIFIGPSFRIVSRLSIPRTILYLVSYSYSTIFVFRDITTYTRIVLRHSEVWRMSYLELGTLTSYYTLGVVIKEGRESKLMSR